MQLHSLAPAIVLTAFAGVALGQSSPFQPIASSADRHTVVYHDVDARGAHWARGRSYKAHATASGFTFIPFLGSDAPRNFPVTFTLRDAFRERASIPLAARADVTRSGDRIVFDRGAVRVCYDLAPDAVEQTFELEHPGGTGDLMIRLGVETELQAAVDGRGFQFRNERGGVSYSEAFAIDASGRTTEMGTRLVDGGLELTVPAAFLDEAVGPIVVDPFLFTFSTGPLNADLASPDAAGGPDFFTVAQEQFSATDLDVYSWVTGAGGAILGGAYVEQTTDSWKRPRVALLSSSGTSLIVAEADSLAFPGSSDIVARARRADGTLEPPFVLKSATSTYSCEEPDVGADSVAQGYFYCVAYSREYGNQRDVHAFATESTPGAITEHGLATSMGHDESSPVVSKATGRGPGLTWMVAWTSRELATSASSISAHQIRYDGNLDIGPVLIAGPTTQGLYIDLDVSNGVSGRFLVTYDDRPSNLTDAFVALVSGGSVQNTIELQFNEHADRTPNQNRLVVATGVDHYLLGYEENGQLYMTILEVINNGNLAILERRRMLVGSNLLPGSLTALERIANSNGETRALFLWSEPTATTSEIVGTYAELPFPDNQAAAWQFCYGEANSTGDRGFIQVLGNRRVMQPHTIGVEALPPSAFGFGIASTMQGFTPNAGGSQGTLCLGGSVGRFGVFQANASGAVSYPLDPQQIPQPMGPVSALAGQRWAFQAWYRDAVGGVPTSNFTNGALLRFR